MLRRLLFLLACLLHSCSSTTLIAARYKGGVVIGADSRTSSGTYIANRFADKMQQVFPGIFICRSGSSADTQYIAEVVKSKLRAYELLHGRPPSTRTAAYMIKNLCYTHKDSLSAGIICAGGNGGIYSIPLGGAIIEQPLALSGSGSTYIVGFCDAEYREDMQEAECAAFVEKALALAMSSDAASGGVIVLCTVTQNGVQKRTVVPDATSTGGKEPVDAFAWR